MSSLRKLVVPLVISALVLAAAASAAIRSSDGLATVNVGDVAPSIPTLPWYVANAEGFFKQHGIQVNVIHVTSVPLGLASGSIDVGNSSLDSSILAAGQGKPAPVLVVLADARSDVLLIRKDLDQPSFHTKYPGNLKDLPKGLTIAVAIKGSSGDQFANLALKEAGVTDFQTIASGGLSGALAAIASKNVQAAILAPPADAQAEAQGYAVAILNAALKQGPADAFYSYGAAVLANPSWAATHPGIAKAYGAAVAQAEAYIQKGVLQPKKYPTIYKHVLADAVAYNTGLDPKIAAQSLKTLAPLYEPGVSCARIGKEINVLITKFGTMQQRPGCSQIALTNLIPKSP